MLERPVRAASIELAGVERQRTRIALDQVHPTSHVHTPRVRRAEQGGAAVEPDHTPAGSDDPSQAPELRAVPAPDVEHGATRAQLEQLERALLLGREERNRGDPVELAGQRVRIRGGVDVAVGPPSARRVGRALVDVVPESDLHPRSLVDPQRPRIVGVDAQLRFPEAGCRERGERVDEQRGPDAAALMVGIDGEDVDIADGFRQLSTSEQEADDSAVAGFSDPAQTGVEVVGFEMLLAELAQGLRDVAGVAGEADRVDRVQPRGVAIDVDRPKPHSVRRRTRNRTDALERATHPPVAARHLVTGATEQLPGSPVAGGDPLTVPRVAVRQLAPLRPLEQARADPPPLMVRIDGREYTGWPDDGVADDAAVGRLDDPRVSGEVEVARAPFVEQILGLVMADAEVGHLARDQHRGDRRRVVGDRCPQPQPHRAACLARGRSDGARAAAFGPGSAPSGAQKVEPREELRAALLVGVLPRRSPGRTGPDRRGRPGRRRAASRTPSRSG